MTTGRPALILFLSILLAVPAVAGSTTDGESLNFFERSLDGLRIGPGITADQLILFPLVAKEKPAILPVVPGVDAPGLTISERESLRRPWDLTLENTGDRPVFVFGGGILTGGRLDRLVPQSVLLPPKGRVEIGALPAAFPNDRRKETAPFSFGHAGGHATAPAFLRERAAFDPSRNLVPIFVSHFLDFRDREDPRRSLAAIDESPLLATFCDECQRRFATFPDLGTKKVVGVITAVRGRVQSLEIFGTNALFRTYFGPTLRAHTYAAAAIALRAKKLGIPIPGHDDPKRSMTAARKQAERLVDELGKKARYRVADLPDGSVGDALRIRSARSDGTAIGLDGRLVHAVVYPENPFEEALYSRAMEIPDAPRRLESVFGELDRREGRGTLSEAEKRLLERMRSRRPR